MLPAPLADARTAPLTALVEVSDGDLTFIDAGVRAANALDVPADRIGGRTAKALGFPSSARVQWVQTLLDAHQDGGLRQVSLAYDTARETRRLLVTATPTEEENRFACVIEDATQPWQAFEALVHGGPALDAMTSLHGGGAFTFGPDLKVVAHGGTLPDGLVPTVEGVATSIEGMSLYDVLPKAGADALACVLLDAADAPLRTVALPGGAFEIQARAVRDERGWPVAGLALVVPVREHTRAEPVATFSTPAREAVSSEPSAPTPETPAALMAMSHTRLRREVQALFDATVALHDTASGTELRAQSQALLDTFDVVTAAQQALVEPPSPEPIRIDAQLQALRAPLEAMTRARGLDLFLFVPDQPVWALGHRAHLAQALLQAVRFAFTTTRRGAIRLAIREQEGTIAIQVADTGAGLPSAVQDALFAGATPSLEDIEASALGLYAAWVLTDAMGGTFTAQSESQRGTLFTFTLPASAPPANEQPSMVPTRPAAVLVEPDENTRDLLTLLLRGDWEVFPAETLAEAFENVVPSLEALHADTILVDLGHDLDPETVIRQLRTHRAFDAAFVVALVVSSLPEEHERYLRLGYDGVLAKPFSRQDLIEVLLPVLG